jgi:MraZ protein
MTAKHASDSFLLSERQRKINRFIFSNANEVNIDNQGRIALPSTLRERCGISDSAVVAGNNNYFEIWEPAGWQQGRPTLEEVRQLADDQEEKK